MNNLVNYFGLVIIESELYKLIKPQGNFLF
jgi:hypothetical protein